MYEDVVMKHITMHKYFVLIKHFLNSCVYNTMVLGSEASVEVIRS